MTDTDIIEIANETHRAMPAGSDEQDEILAIVRACMEKPIDLVLHCPKCGLQHIDYREYSHGNYGRKLEWDNPPHRSHLCHGCGHIWRPADVPTNGVQAVATKGKNDSPIAATPPPPALSAEQIAALRVVTGFYGDDSRTQCLLTLIPPQGN